jgi:hypothetical protein
MAQGSAPDETVAVAVYCPPVLSSNYVWLHRSMGMSVMEGCHDCFSGGYRKVGFAICTFQTKTGLF